MNVLDSIMDRKLATLFVVIMFVVSGVLKVSEPFIGPFSKGVTDYGRMSSRLGISKSLDFYLVFIAGIVELVGAYFILEGKKNVSLGISILMAFTAVATLVFYAFPLKFKPFLSNLSVFSALWLILCR